jgi:hypothetical protein
VVSRDPTAGVHIEILGEEGSSEGTLKLISVAPTSTATGATEMTLVEGTAASSANTGNSVDTIVRPIFDGALSFQDIRDQSAPEEYSWEVQLEAGQYMSLTDPQHVEVYFQSGHPAFAIAAMPAADAIGTTVPTSLKLKGNVITEIVAHRSKAFVYPVIAGVGWEGGYISNEIQGPKDEKELREERERLEKEEREASEMEQYWEEDSLQVGPPEPIPSSEASASTVGGSRKKFVRVICGHTSFGGAGLSANESYTEACGNPFTEDRGQDVVWHAAMRGAFFYKPGDWVEEKGASACDQAAYQISLISLYYVKEAWQCHYGPKTSDGNGGEKASVGHYLRAQAHWEVGHRAHCGNECPSENPTIWEDKALELHLWPSGSIDRTVP